MIGLMRSVLLVLLGAAVAFPLGVLVRDAEAQVGPGPVGSSYDVGYVHLEKADAALHDALAEIAASQRAQESIWSDRRVGVARDAIVKTAQQLDVLVDETAPRAVVVRRHDLLVRGLSR